MTARRWITGCLAATALAPIAIGALTSPALAGGNPITKVTICHATSSAKNPYVLIRPASAGVLHGHVGDHHQDGRDIIPPIDGLLPDGQNWEEGAAIHANECVVPTRPPVLAPPPPGEPSAEEPPVAEPPPAEPPAGEQPPAEGQPPADDGEPPAGEPPVEELLLSVLSY